MRKWKPRLLPVLTCVVMLSAVILPQQLSRWRDQALLDTPHTEALHGENELPTRPLSLLEQMSLIALFNMDNEALTSVIQELGQDSETAAMVRTELERLCDSDVLPPEVLPEDLSEFSSRRLYLRMPGTLTGASFLVMEGYSKQEELYLSLVLSETDGYALWLELDHPAMKKFVGQPVDIGRAFLDRLGVENSCTGYGRYDAVFTTPDGGLQYAVYRDGTLLLIQSSSSDETSVSPIHGSSDAAAASSIHVSGYDSSS